MAEAPAAIRVEGLAQFSRNLKKLDSDLPKVLRLALKQASDLVADDIRPKVPRRTGKARRSIKAKATRTEARVEAWGDRVPYGKWLDWGGRVGRKKATVRPFIAGDGRYVYRSYSNLKKSGQVQAVLEKALQDVATQAGVVIS